MRREISQMEREKKIEVFGSKIGTEPFTITPLVGGS